MADRGKRPRGNPTWTKGGPSPNPGGRPAPPVKLRKLYEENDDDNRIYTRLWFWINSENAKASIAAMSLLLDRRYGRAPAAEEGEKVDLEIETLRAKLKLLEDGHDPDAKAPINIIIPDLSKPFTPPEDE